MQRGTLGSGADVLLGVRGGTVGLAEGVPAGDQGDGLLVVHVHPVEGLADVVGGGGRVRVALRALRVDVDQAHGGRTEGLLQLTGGLIGAVVAGVRAEPVGLRTPEHVLRLPDVLAATAVAQGFEAHRLQCDVAGEHHEVTPGQGLAVLLLDGPEDAAGLVEAAVVGPAVERGEALLAGAGAAAAVGGAVGTGSVPGHTDDQRTVVAEVGGPPGLRRGEDLFDVLLDLGEIECLEGGDVVEVRIGGPDLLRVVGEQVEVEALRPPLLVGVALGGEDEAVVVGARGGLAGAPVDDGAAAGRVSHGVYLLDLLSQSGSTERGCCVVYCVPVVSRRWESFAGGAVVADGPERDFRGENGVHAVRVTGGEARGFTDDALDILETTADHALDVVVVVVVVCLVACAGGTGQVDTAEDAVCAQIVHDIVDGLHGDRREFRADTGVHLGGGAVRVGVDVPQGGEASGGRSKSRIPHAVCPGVGRFCAHGIQYAPTFEIAQS